ncbi:hypothetical protein MLD38_039267 [Melastoma candidum]|uniref:Uncharacterized protein n=1 Tax=Melastoma candidum TaxID=119954 RepID=A0ACB9L317_9MYRT|nr:hypothetical protein MLD38_039267 [Melastoma candidum]
MHLRIPSMAFPTTSPTHSLLFALLALLVIPSPRVLARELRPSDHGLEYQDFPSSPNPNPKPPPGMLSFFGASLSPPSLGNAGGGISGEADSGYFSSDNAGKHDRTRDVLLVASLACGATGITLLMASGLLFLFKYRKDRTGSLSGNTRAPAAAAARPMQPQPPLPPMPRK